MVSVIIPTYKRANYLNRAISSVYNQSYKDYEIIVIDDNGDGTVFQEETECNVNKFIGNNNFYYVKQDVNKGGAVARNLGISLCHGEYITFLDDDDFFAPNRLERLVSLLEREQLKIAYSSCGVIWNNNLKKLICTQPSEDPMLDILKVKSIMGTGSNMFFHKSIFDEIKFDESFKRHQDFEFMIRALEITKNNIAYDSYPSVFKDVSNPINSPNPIDYFCLKEKYLNTFDYLIEKLYPTRKKEIYYNNYKECYRSIVLSKNKDIKKTVLKKLSEYGDLKLIQKLKINIRRKFLNNYFFLWLSVKIHQPYVLNKLSAENKVFLKQILKEFN